MTEDDKIIDKPKATLTLLEIPDTLKAARYQRNRLRQYFHVCRLQRSIISLHCL